MTCEGTNRKELFLTQGTHIATMKRKRLVRLSHANRMDLTGISNNESCQRNGSNRNRLGGCGLH